MQPGEVVVARYIRDDLSRFAHMVWVKPQAISKRHSEGFEYIDLKGCLTGFKALFGGAVVEKILVRDEYRIAAQELQTDRYHRGAYVTGQPGIGKSLFLVYLLVHLLRQGCKVAVHDCGHQFYAVFAESVTFYPVTDIAPLVTGGPMWALSNSGQENGGAPPTRFYAFPKRVRLIQVTSLKKRRWHEWSKQVKAKCYVMDIWTAQEIANLAKLLEYDVQRMVDLGKKWGGDPRTLVTYLEKSDHKTETWYNDCATGAIWNCQNTVRSIVNKYVSEDWDVSSQFYFCRPAHYATPRIDRTEICVTVPTRSICHILGKALQDLRVSNTMKLVFFAALSQPSDTRQAAGFIYQSWFNVFFSTANKFIYCHWLHKPGEVTMLYGVPALVSTIAKDLKARAELPYYWAANTSYEGIDGALISKDAIFAFQITLSSEHSSPQEGVRKLRKELPAELRDLPWHVVFVGNVKRSIKAAASDWAGKVFLTDTSKTSVPIAWSVVDPVARDVTYRVCDLKCVNPLTIV
ncbi:hypothetical protein L210DRAFT_3550214 [Boletus edulis BED1]|uniref:Uncharacterized protein n=1 Tax=Boletus edulis BED1 TaxID=1328754 RepID=A0AAD4BPA2_BOLED|nr:hypothetical protein L210DRAFT_3550214 [Boletus edulis BED1]